MIRYNTMSELEAKHPDFEMNRDFNLLFAVTNHPAVSSTGEYDQVIVEVVTCEYTGETVLEVTRLKPDSGCGSLEPLAWGLRARALPHLKQAQGRSVFAGCFDTAESWCDKPGNTLIDDHFYLYCRDPGEARQLLAEILSPTYNAQFG